MWNDKRSLLLSKVGTLVFLLLVFGVMVGAPWLFPYLVPYSTSARLEHLPLFLATIYIGGALAALLLYKLFRLLDNLGKEKVFTAQNISYLRQISWLCFGGAFLALVSTFYYVPWLVVAVAAAFVGLIVRVVKNLMQQAYLLKQENDFTI